MRCSLFHARVWNYNCHFYFEAVTGDIISKKKNLYFKFAYLEKAFD